MNKQKMLASLKQNFMLKRYKAQEKCDEFIAQLCENKEFNKMYSKYNQLQLESVKTDLEIKKVELNSQIQELKTKTSTPPRAISFSFSLSTTKQARLPAQPSSA